MSRAKELFLNAIENVAPDAWPDYVAAAANGDESLRAQLAQLLAAHQQPDSLLQAPESAVSFQGATLSTATRVGTQVGRYQLLEEIGEGGFGIVYLAEQTEPVRRQVALKILKPGMDSGEVVARFEVERQALAMMNHPHIARVLDGGATDEGRPYFVMELVEGLPITDFCDEHKLDTRQRLRLFVEVVQAVQHAHHKGIIHRDIKPSNVLVAEHDGQPVPKVIDFGIAKAIDQSLTDKTLVTRMGQFIGTPQYISPEQSEIGGIDIDTRSDIYSLGALLYELLTGQPPFAAERFRTASFAEVVRIIRDEQPPRPSQRVSTLRAEGEFRPESPSAVTSAGPQMLDKRLDGDLDWIVMKALEKDRERRYVSASDLADDVMRYLNHEPVTARPPSLGYRMTKFARRNKLALATGLAFATLLIAATIVSLGLARRAQHEANRANLTLEELRDSAPAFVTEARALVAKEQFEEAIEKLDYAIKLQPDNAAYAIAKGDLLESQLHFAEAAAAYRQALEIDPRSQGVATHLAKCESLAERGTDAAGNYPLDLLAELHAIMQAEQRSAAELLPIARLLGTEQEHLLAHWLERLKELPISGKRPLEERLTAAENGVLALDLSQTPVRDLAALEGMPLGKLSLSRCSQLRSLAPLASLPLESLDLSKSPIGDLAPLRNLRSLKELNLSNSEVRDLEPLAGLRLKKLNLDRCEVDDLSPLGGMPLEELRLAFCPIRSLGPLRGMPLRQLDLAYVRLGDFSPLAGAALEKLSLEWTRVGDLAFLAGMPLVELNLWGCQEVSNLAVLSGLENLQVLLLPENCVNLLGKADRQAVDALEEHPQLVRIADSGPTTGDTVSSVPARNFWPDWKAKRALQQRLLDNRFECVIRTVDQESWDVKIVTPAFDDLGLLAGAPIRDLDIEGTKVADLAPVKDLPKLRTLWAPQTAVTTIEPLRGTAIARLNLAQTPVDDLSPLAEVRGLRQLWLGNTPIKSLAPLHGLPLATLWIQNTAIDDLGPLAGMPLTTLVLSGTRVADVAPLGSLPLKTLYLNFTPLTDVCPLAGCTQLEKLLLPAGARNVECLRTLPALAWLEYGWTPMVADPTTTAREFWSSVDSPSQLPPVELAVVSVEPLARNGRAKAAADLLVASVDGQSSEETVLVRMVASALLVSAGDLEGQRRLAEKLLAEYGQTQMAYVADQTLKACLISPQPAGSPEAWDALLAVAEENSRDIEFEPWLHLSAALRAYRQGEFRQTFEDSEVLIHRQGAPVEAKTAALALRSMASRRLGDLASAQQALDEGERLIAPFWPHVQQWTRASWHDWFIARVLLDEAGRASGP